MKRVLYIAYYWPPCGGIGPVRNVKFTKYFRDYGWEPVIYAPQNAQYPLLDESTFKDLPTGVEIIKTPISEPYGFFNLLKGKKKNEAVKDVFLVKDGGSSFMHRFALWVRANFFIPDARAGWIKPSVNYLRKYLKQHPVDAIISYGPPHSMHLIAMALHRELDIPWISDWQDPWTQIDYYEKFPMTKAARQKHEQLEQEVLRTASSVVMVSKSWSEDLKKLSGREVNYIPFGYDEDDFNGIVPQQTGKFIISHFGSFGTDRNPESLWCALQELCSENGLFEKNLEIHLAGHVDASVFEAIEKAGLKKSLRYESFIGKNSLFQQLVNSAVQLVLINRPEPGLKYNNKGRIPAKIFECLGARKPILVIGPHDGDVAHIVNETGAGKNCDYLETTAMKQVIKEWYMQWENDPLRQVESHSEMYSFSNLCKQMSGLLNQL
ncbi:MAG: glycosyl transferase family 1 [Bacteroidia bacterium]|nr:glycosyl transferase family 1 [Bacteroidia bacterium]